MATKIEHSLAEKARAFEELQQRAERFQQFTRSFNKEILTAGQQFMQFYGEFLRATGAAPGAPSGPTGAPGVMSDAGRALNDSVNRSTSQLGITERPRTAAEVVLLSEQQRRRNAKLAGVAPIAQSLFADPQEIAEANRSVIVSNLTKSRIQNEEMVEQEQQFSGVSRDPEKRRRQALIEMYGGRVTQQQALKGRLLEKFPEFRELQDPLASTPVLSAKDRARADALAATGKGTHFRYDVTDIPAAQQLTQRFAAQRSDLTKRIENLRQNPGDGTGRTIAVALENVVRRMDASNNRFAEAVASFNKLSADPNIKEDSQQFKNSLNELRHAIEDLTETNQDLNRTNKAATQFGGGGGGPTQPTLFERMQRFAPYAAAGFGLATAGTMAVMRTGLAMDEAIVGAERRGVEARGNIASRLAARALESQDMADPENLLRYRADLIFGRQFDYIGTEPTSLVRAAQEEMEDALNVDRQRMILGITSAGAGVALGGAQAVGGMAATLGGGGIGAGVGVGMAAHGAQGMMESFGAGIDAVAQNRYLQATRGGLEGSFLGELWRGDDTYRRQRLAIEASRAELGQEFLGNVDRLQDAEIREKFSLMLPAMQERQRMVEARQQGAILVGEYAVRERDLLNQLMGSQDPSLERQRALRLSERAAYFASTPDGEFSQRAQEAASRFVAGERPLSFRPTGPSVEDAREALEEHKRAYRLENFNQESERTKELTRQRVKLTEDLRKAQAQRDRANLVGLPPAVLEQRLETMFEPETDFVRPIDTVSSNLEMAPSEFMSHMNMLTNVLGTRRSRGRSTTVQGNRFGIEGIQAGIYDTERLVNLGRSGLGDFQSLLGNIASLNRVAGGQNNINQLTEVMASAVTAGFDKSRTAQMFVQTSTELAKSLNLTNVSNIASQLGRQATLTSVTGIADERSLERAAQGIQTYNQFTAQRGGLVGALRAARVFEAGGKIGRGASMMMGLSVSEAQEMLAQLPFETQGASPEMLAMLSPEDRAAAQRDPTITNDKLQQIMLMNRGETSAVRSQLQGLVSGSNQIYKAIYSSFGGDDINRRLAAIKKAQAEGDTARAIQLQKEFIAHGAGVGETMGIGYSAGQAGAMQVMVESGIESNLVNLEAIEGKIAAGKSAFRDPAQVNLRKYMDNLLRDLGRATTGVTPEQYAEFVRKTGQRVRFDESAGDLAGEEIQPERMRSDAGYMELARKSLGRVDTLDFIRGASMHASQLQGDVQKVDIQNTTVLAGEIARAIRGKEAATLSPTVRANLNE